MASKSVKRRKPKFGQLLEFYREQKGISQSDLERLLIENNFIIGHTVVNKYESGSRTPTAAFIYNAALCLGLTGEQTFALVHACAADTALEFFKEFINVWNTAHSKEKKRGRE